MQFSPIIFLIGSGNVAWHLASAFYEKGIRFSGLYNRTPEHAVDLAEKLHCPLIFDLKNVPQDADIYLICTSDSAIDPVSAALPKVDGLVAHVSGTASIDAIAKKHQRRGVFYPLQTFTKNRRLNFKEIPILLEANNENDGQLLSKLAHCLSDTVISLSEEQRKALHLAAVFSCNFTNFMYALSSDILQKNGLDFQLLTPLIRETAQRTKETNNPIQLQTGPAIRNDQNTIQKHLDFLQKEPQLQNIYRLLTEAIKMK